LNYSRGTHRFNSLRSGSLEIEIETSPDVDGTINLNKEWNKAFLTSAEEYPLDMQPYWRPFISCVINPKTEECEYYEKKSWEPDVYNVNPASTWTPTYPDVYRIGGDVTPPKPRSKVDPQLTEIARSARVQGTVLLEAIVTKQGAVKILRIVRPLGFGLEENAAEALSQWTFQPAMRLGQPVDVLLQIEINFFLR
jgi:TonB family protein